MTTTMKAAMQKAAKAKASTQAPAIKAEPLVRMNIGQWLKGPLVRYMREKYAKDRDAAQRGCDWLVETGRVQVPPNGVLVAVAIRQFGGSLSFVCNPIGDAGGSAKPKLDLNGMPD